jgi:hypothetical protein
MSTVGDWCEMAASLGFNVRQSPASNDVNTEAEEATSVGSRYQATTGMIQQAK